MADEKKGTKPTVLRSGITLEEVRKKLEAAQKDLSAQVDGAANDLPALLKVLVRAFVASVAAQHEIALQLAEYNTRETAAEVRLKVSQDFINGIAAELQRQQVVIPGGVPKL